MSETKQTNAPATPGRDSIETLVELGRAIGQTFMPPGGEPYMVVPQTYRVEGVGKFMPPWHVAAKPRFQDAASFALYVNRYKTPETVLFADVTDGGAELTAILDYHEAAVNGSAPGEAARCAHRAVVKLEPTKEWKDWCAADAKRMNQLDFCTWLEDRLPLLREPSGAELLELIQTLEGKSEVRFMSAMRLVNGKNCLQYDEDVELRGGSAAGTVTLPPTLTAAIAPFHGCALYEVPARLKHRIEGRKLSLWYETVRPHVIVRDAVQLLLKQVQEQTGITAWMGAPLP